MSLLQHHKIEQVVNTNVVFQKWRHIFSLKVKTYVCFQSEDFSFQSKDMFPFKAKTYMYVSFQSRDIWFFLKQRHMFSFKVKTFVSFHSFQSEHICFLSKWRQMFAYFDKFWGQLGLATILLFEHNTGEKSCDLSWMELGQNVLKHQLRDHDLVVANLTGNTTF